MGKDMQRIEAGENLMTEFKRKYTEEIKKTIIAFANTAGGTLYIGINDDRSVAGVDNPDDTLLQITNTVRSAIKPDLTLFVDCKKETIKKAAVVVVTVQRGTACPYYLAGKGIRPEGVYVRQGASSVPATETAILNMIKETDGEKYEEVRSLNQDLTFSEAAPFFERENVPFGLNQQKTLRLQTTDGVYTNLGLLFSDQAVHTVKLAVFEGSEKEVFKDRQEFSGSLLKQMGEAYEHLDIHNRTHAEVERLTRLEKRDYPEEALREALLNALVHRDYAFSSSTLISIFDDRVEFVSVGGLPKGVSLDDILLGISVPRNENLANVFYRLRLIEVYGTGIPKIMRSYAHCDRKPELKATGNAFKITLPNRNVVRHEWIGDKAPLSENEEKIIALLDRQGEIVRKDVETDLGISQAMAVRLLRGLADKEAIRVIGGGKNTRYRKIVPSAY
ncbi:MAG: putative DNA binding domain-containing protein [Treponema sp.]|jgi:ATP-dependent DNA helicase RecG|nr:putative DNA binding domain-containing protein [Treponema sp.]